MQVDYISDLHLDFYIKHNGDYKKWEVKTHEFLKSLLPNKQGEILTIAGDLSHYNIQSFWAVEFFSKVYEHVFVTFGNHDYYLVSNGQRKKYKNNSVNRVAELYFMLSEIGNVTVLQDFEVKEYKGYKIAGSTSWYPLTEFKDYNFFKTHSNDSVLIAGLDIKYENYREHEKYKAMEDVDILVTHVPPIMIDSHHIYGESSCYLNELKDIKANYHVFGHCHEQAIYNKAGIRFSINALGYPQEWINHMNPMNYSRMERLTFLNAWNKIKGFNVRKSIDNR